MGSTPFTFWLLVVGIYVVLAGVLIPVAVHRMLTRRSRKLPAHRADASVGRAYTSRAADGGGLARGPVVAAGRADGAATTSLLPLAPAAAVLRGGGLRAGWGGTPLAPAGPTTVRFDGAPVTAPRRAVAAPFVSGGAATLQLPARPSDQRNPRGPRPAGP